jgi:putative ABC transport system substrate-binding protein
MVAGPDRATMREIDEAFRRGLRDHGHVEGGTIQLEVRYQSDRDTDWDDFAAEFVAWPADVIVVPHSQGLEAVARVTHVIPTIALMEQDPAIPTLIESHARPGGNVTGIAGLQRSLGAKLLELLRELAPSARVVGVVWGGPYEIVLGGPYVPGASEGRVGVYGASASLGFEVLDVHLSDDPEQLPFTLRHVTRRGIDSLIIPAASTYATRFRREIATYALERRIPLAAEQQQVAEAGGLVAFGVDRLASFGRLASFVDRILKGTKPGDIPIEQPSKFETVLNLKTATAIGLAIPQSVLSRATRVIQ